MLRQTLCRNLLYISCSKILIRNITSAPCFCISQQKTSRLEKNPIEYIKLNNFIRTMSSIEVIPASIGYEEVKKINGTNEYLIDVRERDEIRESGAIPGAINIPLSEIQLALTQLSPETFTKKYGRDKPSEVAYIVFSCRSGKRANMAAQLAAKLGYKDVAYYGGSWLDWEAQNKKQFECEEKQQ